MGDSSSSTLLSAAGMPVDVEFEGGRAVDRLIGGGLKNRQLHIIQQDTQTTIGHSRQSLNSRLDREDVFRKASFEGDLPLVKQLLAQGIPVDCTMAGDGVTALMLASQRGHVDVVRLLLDRGAEVNRGDRHHEQPILYAFRKSRSQETLSVLLEHDADVDAVDADSRTLLMLASSNGMAGMVYQLLLFGADPYLTSKGTTAMHFAIMLDQKEALAQMLSHGVDANHWDYEKRTPLMLAARAGSAEMVTLLFENRADPLIEDTTGLTALEYCGDDQKMICAFAQINTSAVSNGASSKCAAAFVVGLPRESRSLSLSLLSWTSKSLHPQSRNQRLQNQRLQSCHQSLAASPEWITEATTI